MLDHGDLPVRPELATALQRTWEEIGRPGARWTGAQRVEILEAARDTPSGAIETGATLPPAARDAACRIAMEPAGTTERWVSAVVDAIGEPEYVELAGVVARVAAVDTFCRLLGLDPPAPPDPVPGEITNEPVPVNARRNRTWVRMVTPNAPLVLGAVPSAETAVNDLCDRLYMPPHQIGDHEFRRGRLDRPRMELVAATTSVVNECFY